MKSTHVHFYTIFLNVHSKKNNPSRMLEIEKLTWNVLGYCKKLKCRLPKTQSAFTILTLHINFQRYYTVKIFYTNYKNIIKAVLILF